MKRLCFFHDYTFITPSFMHLFVAKDVGDTPSAVPMYAGRECSKCGKRHAIPLQDIIPDIIKQRVEKWRKHELENIVQGEQLLTFSKRNKTIFIKDLESFMIAHVLEQAGMSGIVILPGITGSASMGLAEAEEEIKKANLQLVVNNAGSPN